MSLLMLLSQKPYFLTPKGTAKMADTAALENSGKIRTARQSPAVLLAPAFESGSSPGIVELRELRFQTMAGLRVDPRIDAGQRLAAVVGGLPAVCGEVRGAGDVAIVWQGPTEFLAIAPPEAHESLGGDLLPALREALSGGEGQVVDLSANRTTFELTGPRARDVLEKGCSLDLHPRVLKPGTAVSTEIGNIPAILWKTGDESFRILPRASFAQFLGSWLLDAMREYASPEVP
jgi:sarcosine oxidase subunit gamma